MTNRHVARKLAATTTAASALALFGTGAADANPGNITWSDGSSQFTRTISNVSPAEGDTITVSTQFSRNSWTDEYIYNIKDRHPACATYVPGSATMGGGAVSNPEVVADEGNGGGYVRASFGSTSWVVQNRPGFHSSPTFSVQYKVGHGCARGAALTTGMDYGGSLGSGSYGTQGPSITVGKNATTTALAPVSGARAGQPVTLTATVTGGSAGDTIGFYDGGTQIGTGALDATGTATYQWTPTASGNRTLTAQYPGTASANASQSAPQTVNVTPADVASTITLNPVTGAKVGTATTLTAKVTPAAAGGTVQFADGATVLGTGQVDGTGTATYQWTPADAGAHTLTATFSGRDGVTGSNTTGQVSVVAADVASTTTLNPVTGAKVGTATTLTAKVSPAAAGGTVEFADGTTILGTGQVDGTGTATFQWTPSAAGAHTLTATFSGRDGVTGSNTTGQVSVVAADVASTTVLNPVAGAKVGTATTLTATVTPAAAGGTVQFADGATVLGTGQVDGTGTATLQWTPSAAGAHTLTATFSGRDGVTGSNTTAQADVAAADVASTTTFNPVTGAKVGTATTLTAKVTPAAAGGTVQFADGATVLGTGQVDATGTATFQWTPAAAGAHTLTATFSGRDGVTGSNTTAQADVAAAAVASTTTLNPVTGAKVGTATTLTATVTPAAAGGTIEFADGATVLGTGQVDATGTSTFQWTPSAAGAHTLTATFSGRDGVTGSNTTTQANVAAADSNSTVTVNPVTGATVGTAITLTAKVNPANAGGTITFTDGGTVIGTTAQVGADGTATITWTPTTAGSHIITADYSGNGTVNASTTTATITVAPAGGTGTGTGSSLPGSLGSR
ncbi:beta strand repeat-containing protein [Nocardia sp. CA-136227]|uniref:beta strand repeat-containing protein n=1 Tax=Nocardia sp. CA-136227 TaxID=3239979 RepID=UPI003D97F66B